MTAIDLRASTMKQAKRAQQKATIRQMVGILHEENAGDWKCEKEEALVEKYQQTTFLAKINNVEPSKQIAYGNIAKTK